MTTDNSTQRTGRAPVWPVLAGVGVPLLLLGVYVGAYLALARPVRFTMLIFHVPGGAPTSNAELRVLYVPSAWEPWFQRAFTPLEAVDRRLRPELWETH
jgi:hypothetical protein